HHPPIWVAEGSGAHFTDVDGHDYLDMHIADASAFCGHAPDPLVRAVTQQIERGNQFQLPGEDAIWVAEHLVHRYGLPKGQLTPSDTPAKTEVTQLVPRGPPAPPGHPPRPHPGVRCEVPRAPPRNDCRAG